MCPAREKCAAALETGQGNCAASRRARPAIAEQREDDGVLSRAVSVMDHEAAHVP